MDTTITLQNKVKLHYRSTGNGHQNVIIIPGGPGLTLDYLQKLHQIFDPALYTVYSYEPSGYPNSNNHHLKFVHEYAIELASLVQALDLKDFILVGHSFGASIAMEYLVNEGNKATKAILISAFPSGKFLKSSILNRIEAFPADARLRIASLKSNFDPEIYWQLVSNYWLTSHLYRCQPMTEEFLLSLGRIKEVDSGVYFLGENIFNINGVLLNWDVSHRLKEINIPCMIIAGQYDYYTMEETISFAKKIPHHSYWISENASHSVFLEDTENFKQQVLEFI